MKIKHFKKNSTVLLLGFILIINTIPVSFAQPVQYISSCYPGDNCPTGCQPVSSGIINGKKCSGDYVACTCSSEISTPPPVNPGAQCDKSETDINTEIANLKCTNGGTAVWDRPNCKAICSAGSNIQQTDFSGLKKVVPAYVPRVEIPCNTKIAGGACPANWKTDLGSYVGRLYQFGLMIAGIIAFAVIIYGAAQYTLSAGGFASKEDAKDIMLNAIYGLLLLFGAYLVLYTINPNLVKLGNFQIEPINLSEFNPPEQVYISGDNNKVSESSGTAGIPGCLVAVSEAGGLLGTGFQAGLTVTSDQGTQQYGTDTTKKMLCTKCDETIYTKENGKCCLSIISNACVNCDELKASTNNQLISLFGQNQTQAIKNKCKF